MTASRGGSGALPSVGQLDEFPPENTENGTNSDDNPSTIHSYITNHHEDSVTRLFVTARILKKNYKLHHNINCDTPQALLLQYFEMGADSILILNQNLTSEDSVSFMVLTWYINTCALIILQLNLQHLFFLCRGFGNQL